MDFLKQNSWILIAIAVVAIVAAIFSGIKSMQGRQALPVLTAPASNANSPAAPGSSPGSSSSSPLSMGNQGGAPPP